MVTASGADAALGLWILHELHYRGFDGVDDALEWHPTLLEVRSLLERDLETFAVFHFRGHWFDRGIELAEATRRAAGASTGSPSRSWATSSTRGSRGRRSGTRS